MSSISQNLLFRKATEEDIPEIARLLIEVWQTCYTDFVPQHFLDGLGFNKQIQRHKAYLDRGVNYLICIDKSNLGLLGFTSFGVSRFDKYEVDIELYSLYVDPTIQGQGIGTRFIEEIFKDPFNAPSELIVSVFADNPYKGFYEKNGFRQIGKEHIDFGSFGLEAFVMLLERD